MSNVADRITAAEALKIPSTELPACRFAEPEDAWRSDAWETLRDMVQTDETAAQACGSELIFSYGSQPNRRSVRVVSRAGGAS